MFTRAEMTWNHPIGDSVKNWNGYPVVWRQSCAIGQRNSLVPDVVVFITSAATKLTTLKPWVLSTGVIGNHFYNNFYAYKNRSRQSIPQIQSIQSNS